MTPSNDENKSHLSRRKFLSHGLMAVAAAGLSAHAAPEIVAALKDGDEPRPDPIPKGDPIPKSALEPFWGGHQGGILTPLQHHTYFAAFDLTTTKRGDVIKLLQAWTAAAARMAQGQTAEPLGSDPTVPAPDSGDVLGLPPARLTITFGFGAGLFLKDGVDRYGLAAHRPAALVDLPKFPGDQLVDAQSGGDLSVQACSDDPQIALHAIRELTRLVYDAAQIRWVQTGFTANFGAKETPRNLMGFKDGTNNPSIGDSKLMNQFIWVGDEGPLWMRGGSYLVNRRIRIGLEHWDRMNVAFQEQTIGRKKYTGAPLGGIHEHDHPDYYAKDKDGNSVIPDNAHIRLASGENNDGAQILRRPYSYNDGVNLTAERWPPWREAMEFDAGLLFLCYQRDPRTGFMKLFEKVSRFDMMNQFVTHVGGGLFACPGGMAQGEYIGQRLFERA